MAVKKLLCGAKDCDGVIAHQLTDKTFELKRTDRLVTMTSGERVDDGDLPEEPEPQDLDRRD